VVLPLVLLREVLVELVQAAQLIAEAVLEAQPHPLQEYLEAQAGTEAAALPIRLETLTEAVLEASIAHLELAQQE
jgi:hypothetical protein